MELREGSDTDSRKLSQDFPALGSYQVATPSSIDPSYCQCVSPLEFPQKYFRNIGHGEATPQRA